MNTVEPMCPVCHLGKLQEQKITYTLVFEGELIVIPNASALVCDICGEKVLDHEILTRLSGLLGQDRRNIRPATPPHSRL